MQASLHAANNKRELPSSTEQDCAIQLMPMAPYGRLPLSQSWQAFTLAQVTASNRASAGVDEGLGSDCSSVVAAATMAATAALNAGISQDVWRATLSSVLPFLAKPSGSSYSTQQSTVPGISAAIPAIQSTSWPPGFLEIADASIDGQTETSKPCMGLNNGEKDVLCSQLEGAILRPEEHIVESKFQSGGNVRMVVSTVPQSLPVSLPLTGMMEPSFAAGDRPRVSSSEHLGDTSCCLPAGQFPCVSKLVNPSVFSLFGGITASLKTNCGTAHVLSGAAAAAAEARQKCRGLKRSRSLQRHWGAQFF